MSAERDELLRLVQAIPDDLVPLALADVRRHMHLTERQDWPPAWFGIAEGDGSDIGARSEDLLKEGFGRSA